MQFVRSERIVEAFRRGASFFSFVIGLGIAAILFHRDYAIRKTPALPMKEMIDKIVRIDGKCFRYRVEDASCETSSSR